MAGVEEAGREVEDATLPFLLLRIGRSVAVFGVGGSARRMIGLHSQRSRGSGNEWLM